MEIRLQKWGNSVGIRIPNNLLKSLNLKVNDVLNIKEEDNKIIISKSKKGKVNLEELFNNYDGENLSKEFVWDEPRGREIW